MEKYVYVVLTHTQSIVGKALRCFMKYKYNHASISLDKELQQMYSFGRISMKNPLVGGIRQEKPYNFSMGVDKEVAAKIYRIPVNEEQYEKIKAFVEDTYKDFDGYYYNLLGILGIALGRQWKLYKTYICSEFIMESLKCGEIEVGQKASSLVSPKDIGELMDNYLYFEGDLFRYPHLVIDSADKDIFSDDTFFTRIGFTNEVVRSVKHFKMLIARHYRNGRKQAM